MYAFVACRRSTQARAWSRACACCCCYNSCWCYLPLCCQVSKPCMCTSYMHHTNIRSIVVSCSHLLPAFSRFQSHACHFLSCAAGPCDKCFLSPAKGGCKCDKICMCLKPPPNKCSPRANFDWGVSSSEYKTMDASSAAACCSYCNVEARCGGWVYDQVRGLHMYAFDTLTCQGNACMHACFFAAIELCTGCIVQPYVRRA